MLSDTDAVAAAARQAVQATTITDVHTHLFPPSHGDLLLWGVDELLTYHYLVAELFTVAPKDLSHQKFWSLDKAAQADLIWEHVFLNRGALSEAARGAITTLNLLGLDVAGRDLASIRKWFAEQTIDEYLPRVFELAGLDYAVMTNNPFLPEETQCLSGDLPCPDCLKPALRIDPLLVSWESAAEEMLKQGYQVKADINGETLAEVRRFLADWTAKIKPAYFAASLGPDFVYPDDSSQTWMLDEAIVPAAAEAGVPFAMMIGVRKGVNPQLGDGGDAVGPADVSSVMRLCQSYPHTKFLVTMLSRVNQHELCVLARKFTNLHLFGCWWFCNNPSIIEEMTRQRIELLGTAFTAQHSDARVLDQLIYKWTHTRKLIGDVLADKYSDLFAAGWRPTKEEIARDVRNIFGGAFEQFLAR